MIFNNLFKSNKILKVRKLIQHTKMPSLITHKTCTKLFRVLFSMLQRQRAKNAYERLDLD